MCKGEEIIEESTIPVGCSPLNLSLADLLGLSPPLLPTAASLSKSSLQIVDGSSSFLRSGEEMEITGGIWDEEDDKKFYEDIIDLADEVPAALLGLGSDGQKTELAKLETNGQIDSLQVATPPTATAESSPLTRTASSFSDNTVVETLPSGEADEGRLAELDTKADEDAEPIQSGPAARLNAIFAALPEASNRTLIDKLAVEFAFLNSKGARKRMWKVGCPDAWVPGDLLIDSTLIVSRCGAQEPNGSSSTLREVRRYT